MCSASSRCRVNHELRLHCSSSPPKISDGARCHDPAVGPGFSGDDAPATCRHRRSRQGNARLLERLELLLQVCATAMICVHGAGATSRCLDARIWTALLGGRGFSLVSLAVGSANSVRCRYARCQSTGWKLSKYPTDGFPLVWTRVLGTCGTLHVASVSGAQFERRAPFLRLRVCPNAELLSSMPHGPQVDLSVPQPTRAMRILRFEGATCYHVLLVGGLNALQVLTHTINRSNPVKAHVVLAEIPGCPLIGCSLRTSHGSHDPRDRGRGRGLRDA